jgi:hypothetical protein
MGHGAHRKSDFKLRKLPTCSRCKQQFVLVLASYGQGKKPIYEWECTKCYKTVKRDFLKEQESSRDEQFFNNKFIELEKWNEENKRRDRQATLRNHY